MYIGKVKQMPIIDNPFIRGIKKKHRRLREIERFHQQEDEPDGSEVWEPTWQTCTLMMLVMALGTFLGWAINGIVGPS